MYGSSFDTICVIIVYCKDIYGRYCIKRSNNDHFHPWRWHFSFSLVCPLRNHVTLLFIPSVLKWVQSCRVSWLSFSFFTVGIILARRLFWQPDETRCFTDSFPQNPVLTCSPFVVRLQPRLGGSGQIFERTKTCTVPPFPLPPMSSHGTCGTA